jgi:hypothetical protein
MLLMEFVLVGGYLVCFVRFCALIRHSADGTIFRMSACMDFALWTTALIVRFWGVIPGRVSPVFLRS